MKQYLLALSTLTGTIIGVGFFGLPYVSSRIGFYPMLFYFFFLALISILVHLIFSEICLKTPGNHRLPGYAQIYLGKEAKWLSVFSTSLGLFGSNLAYIIVGGSFLAGLLMPILGGNLLIYTLIYFSVGAILVYFGSKSISEFEFFGLAIFFIAFIFIFVVSLRHIDIANHLTANFSLVNLFLPYGIILFSLSGMSIIPEIKELSHGNKKKMRSLVINAIIISTLTYIAFVFITQGVCGNKTTPDALDGLKNILGYRVLIAGFVVGVIATFTSYISSALTLKKIFSFDLKLPQILAWLLASFVPILLYFLGLNDFIKIIGFIGAVTLGIDSIMIFLIYLKVKIKFSDKNEPIISLPKFAVYVLSAMLLIGVGLELLTTFKILK